ncbi:HpcH/HpaI aldolase/citrate lyase family protein [Lysinibacillus piscis]|uniref:ATP/GTP-binding protein n=1 Tax=Lysinibacillus piscis TaxID=2518931 RepID=A0ABQ5NPH8_9BACI|nr:HpcH/HpaI aldolase/citrate lyase family protein [Lysinibacillus sp. KH24]GLC90286.1 ATP/GTP-binding protein [Lysinibacillus sp. KH24]
MQYFSTAANTVFYQQPQSFTKWDAPAILAYALGATLYMPASMPSIVEMVQSRKYPNLTSFVIDLEDAVGDKEVVACEEKVVRDIRQLYTLYCGQEITAEQLPLIFIRVRSVEQLQLLATALGEQQKVLTGYVFPKFTATNGQAYFTVLEQIIEQYELTLYGMPILESREIIYKESRMDALCAVKQILQQHRERVLNVRIGATDFCGIYGIRRQMDATIYDIGMMQDCIADIVNVLGREEDGFVISGPVWEYLHAKNTVTEGLMKEVILDKQNGLLGKTIIHPSHIRIVQALYAVSYEDYMDACDIVERNDGQQGVFKSYNANKMNEIKPHMRWAQKIMHLARIYGVLHESVEQTALLKYEEVGESKYAEK